MKELLCSYKKQGLIVSFDITVGKGEGTNEDTGEKVWWYGYQNNQFGNATLDSLYMLVSIPDGTVLIDTSDLLPLSDVILKRLDNQKIFIFKSGESDPKSSLKVSSDVVFTEQDLDKTIPIEIRFA